jgi:hypothetical protein
MFIVACYMNHLIPVDLSVHESHYVLEASHLDRIDYWIDSRKSHDA